MSHLNTRMPNDNDTTQRDDLKPAFSNDLFEQMLQPENFQQAWKQVRANKGAAGVDGMSIDDFLAWVKSGAWSEVKETLRNFSCSSLA